MSKQNKKNTPTKQWQKPDLIVLVRNSPEETVLTTCKTTGLSTWSSLVNTGCEEIIGGPCLTCNSLSSS